MNRITSIAMGVVLTTALATESAAQWNVARFGSEPNRVYTTFGLDPAFVGSMGYGRVVNLNTHHFLLSGDLGVVTNSMDARDFRARVGMQTSVLRWRSVHLTGTFTAIARGTENSIYKGFNWGADVTGALGVYRPAWFAAGEFGRDKAIITHVTHSDWYRDNFYPDAKDGWYLDGGGTYHYGVSSGVSLGRTEVVGRAGWVRTEKMNDVMVPMYVSLGVGLRY